MIESKRRRRVIANIASYFVLATLSMFCIGPMIWMFLTSLKYEADIVTQTMQYIPRRVTFDNYVAIWTQSGFPRLIANSLVVTFLTVTICVATGTLAAYAFSRFAFRGRTQLMLGYLIVRMFPAVMMIIPLYVVMRGVGLVDSRFGLALAYTSFLLPLFVWMLKGFFDSAPKELESAARIDGSTRLGAMVRIVMPLAHNGLVASSVFIAIAAWNEFLFALMLTSQNARTAPVAASLFVSYKEIAWGSLSAAGAVIVLPILIFALVVQRHLVRGLTAGAVKE